MPVPHRLDWVPPSGCLVSQPSRLLTTPVPHQGAGGREMPPCLCVCARWGPAGGGGAFKAGAHLCRSPVGRGWCVWGVVCARCSGPQRGGGGGRHKWTSGVAQLPKGPAGQWIEPRTGARRTCTGLLSQSLALPPVYPSPEDCAP